MEHSSDWYWCTRLWLELINSSLAGVHSSLRRFLLRRRRTIMLKASILEWSSCNRLVGICFGGLFARRDSVNVISNQQLAGILQ